MFLNVKNKKNKKLLYYHRSARPVKQFTRESSGDDLSVRSDVSRGELRERLKGERKSKNEQEEVLKHLQVLIKDLCVDILRIVVEHLVFY